MKSLEELVAAFNEKHPVVAPLLYFVVAFALLVIMIWFLLFSGLNTSADFVYNQFWSIISGRGGNRLPPPPLIHV